MGSRRAIAADDFVGLRYVGTELAEVVTSRDGAAAYRVEPADGAVREDRIQPRLLVS